MSYNLPPKILVIESDEESNLNLCNAIERNRLDTIRVSSYESALQVLDAVIPNLIIVSSRTGDKPALEVANKLIKSHNLVNMPFIFTIEESESEENYKMNTNISFAVIKRPVAIDKLMNNIRVLLRKTKNIFQNKILDFNDIKLDLSTYKVYRQTKEIHLGPTEFKMLQLFVQNPKIVYSRNDIIDYVWGTDTKKNISHRTVDVHINRIRSLMKIKDDECQLIKTVRSYGYCLE